MTRTINGEMETRAHNREIAEHRNREIEEREDMSSSWKRGVQG